MFANDQEIDFDIEPETMQFEGTVNFSKFYPGVFIMSLKWHRSLWLPIRHNHDERQQFKHRQGGSIKRNIAGRHVDRRHFGFNCLSARVRERLGSYCNLFVYVSKAVYFHDEMDLYSNKLKIVDQVVKIKKKK